METGYWTAGINEPMRESNWYLVHLECWSSDCKDDMRSCLHSAEMLAVMVEVSISISRNVRWIVGPSIFDGFTGTFSFSNNESMAERLLEHSWEAGAPAVKNHQDKMMDRMFVLQDPVNAMDSWLNKNGVECRPNGRKVSTYNHIICPSTSFQAGSSYGDEQVSA